MNYRVKEKITMADLAFRVQYVVNTETDVTQAQLARNGIEVLAGIAGFLDPTHIRVQNSRAQSDYEAGGIIIAAGTRPANSPKVPFNNRNIINSDQILQMPEIPKTMIVVGGRVVGVEYTCMFATLGVRVILIEKRSRLLGDASSVSGHGAGGGLRKWACGRCSVRRFCEDVASSAGRRDRRQCTHGRPREILHLRPQCKIRGAWLVEPLPA